VEALCTVIEKAQQMDILVPSAEGPDRPLTFGYELARQTLLAGIAAPRQQRFHAGGAAAMERLDPRAVTAPAGATVDPLHKAGSFADARKLAHYVVGSQ